MEICGFEIAKKLKEKGFKEKCLTYYDVIDNVGLLYNTQYTNDLSPCQYTDLLQSHNTDVTAYQSDDSEYCVDAPTISQVMKWLRETHNIHIFTDFFLSNGDTKIHWIYRIRYIKDDSTEDNPIYWYQSHEDAALAGINYVLDII